MTETLLILLPLLIQVESSGSDSAIGDSGKAVGCLQIHKITVRDVNRISGKNYSYSDRQSRKKSIEMATIYFNHYSKHYERATGKKATMKEMSMWWNAGYGSHRKTHKYHKKGLKYWEKVKRLKK